MKLKLTLPNNTGVITMDVPDGTAITEFGTPSTMPLPAPGSYTLTPAQQKAKTEALKTVLPLAQANQTLLRKLGVVFYELMTVHVTDPEVVRRYQQSSAGSVCEPLQALVEAATTHEARLDVLVGIWYACQDALKTVK